MEVPNPFDPIVQFFAPQRFFFFGGHHSRHRTVNTFSIVRSLVYGCLDPLFPYFHKSDLKMGLAQCAQRPSALRRGSSYT